MFANAPICRRLWVVFGGAIELKIGIGGMAEAEIDEFDEATKQRFMDEDSEAWNSICVILGGIISIGLILAVLAVTIVL